MKAVMKHRCMFFSTFAVLWQTSKPYCDAHTSETAEISGDKVVRIGLTQLPKNCGEVSPVSHPFPLWLYIKATLW